MNAAKQSSSMSTMYRVKNYDIKVISNKITIWKYYFYKYLKGVVPLNIFYFFEFFLSPLSFKNSGKNTA